MLRAMLHGVSSDRRHTLQSNCQQNCAQQSIQANEECFAIGIQHGRHDVTWLVVQTREANEECFVIGNQHGRHVT